MSRPSSHARNACRENVAMLLERFGSINKLSQAVGLTYLAVRQLKEGEELTDDQAARVERELSLPQGWMSQRHPEGLDGAGRIGDLAGSPEDNSAQMQQTRRANVALLIGPDHGAKTRFAKAMKWHTSEVQHLGRRTLGHRKARAMESRLGLPGGWLDSPRALSDVPAEVRAAIDDATPMASGNKGGAHLEQTPSLASGAGGPLARALLETLVSRINEGALTEKRAHELLGLLLRES